MKSDRHSFPIDFQNQSYENLRNKEQMTKQILVLKALVYLCNLISFDSLFVKFQDVSYTQSFTWKLTQTCSFNCFAIIYVSFFILDFKMSLIFRSLITYFDDTLISNFLWYWHIQGVIVKEKDYFVVHLLETGKRLWEVLISCKWAISLLQLSLDSDIILTSTSSQ